MKTTIQFRIELDINKFSIGTDKILKRENFTLMISNLTKAYI